MGFSHLSRDIRLLIWEITLRRKYRSVNGSSVLNSQEIVTADYPAI